jgi:anion-transporting  ArsA/GET3 family ATPase
MSETPRVLIVSGKGGTGKTIVAASLAFVAARRGLATLLLELEGRAGAAPLLGLEPTGVRESETPFGFSIASVGPREALLEYLGLFYGMTRLAGPLLRSRAVEAVTEVAPGFRDLMLAGKVYETAEWRRHSKRAGDRARYDLVVADAPPTGQIVPFLSAPAAFREILRVGKPSAQAGRIDAFLHKRARVLLVTTPEELPVAETLEARAAIEALGVPLGPVVVNRVLPPLAPRGTRRAVESLDATVIAERAGLRPKEAHAVTTVARRHGRAEAEQRTQIRRLQGLDRIELPRLFEPGFGRAEIERLSTHLAAAW